MMELDSCFLSRRIHKIDVNTSNDTDIHHNGSSNISDLVTTINVIEMMLTCIGLKLQTPKPMILTLQETSS